MITEDINGDKRNQYGHKLTVEDNCLGVTAGARRYLDKKHMRANDSHFAEIFVMGSEMKNKSVERPPKI